MKRLLTIFFLFSTLLAQAQDTIPFSNGSFEGEDYGSPSITPQGWIPFTMGTTPDILPGAWGVELPPSHGPSYIGLITREDGSYESITQRLGSPLEGETCYRFTVDLAHSKTYSGYNLPIRLRIWAGNKLKKEQLVWESDLIHQNSWQTHEVKFYTKSTYHYLFIEAYFAPGIFFKYRGNVLIDHLTDIIRCTRA